MLTERDIQILRAIVDLYVRDDTPVSSLRVQEHLGTPFSTATIRNVMARLEGEGFLAKPHTSAGRVPTEVGYRAYVDLLEANLAFAETFARTFRDTLREQDADVGGILSAASRVLSAMSKNFAMVYGSVVQERRVTRIQLVELEGPRLLVAVNLAPDHERTSVLRMDRRFSSVVVARAEELINREVRGKTLQEARTALESVVRDNVTDEGIIAREVAIHREGIFSDTPALEFYFEQPAHVFGQTEFSDPKLLQLLLQLFQNRSYLTSLLSSRAGEMQVTIGKEHQDQELQPFSLVTTGYRMGIARGVLGIIGPTRMPYDLIYALVGSAARGLETVGGEYL
jgi:heat-inducible transcriptional repressor